jgi:hypothetical protein
MNHRSHLRPVVLGIGLFVLANAWFSAASGLSRLILWALMSRNEQGSWDTTRVLLLDDLIHTALLVLPAIVLLTRTDWCVGLLQGATLTEESSDETDEEEIV